MKSILKQKSSAPFLLFIYLSNERVMDTHVSSELKIPVYCTECWILYKHTGHIGLQVCNMLMKYKHATCKVYNKQQIMFYKLITNVHETRNVKVEITKSYINLK